MARDAAEPALACLETLAEFHLLNLPDRVILPLVVPAVDRKELDERQTRTIVERVTTQSVDTMVAQKMALLAHSVPECGLKVPRIDD